jgi:hypothetical protein
MIKSEIILPSLMVLYGMKCPALFKILLEDGVIR